MSALTFLPSPLLGSAVWEPVAEVAREAGWDVAVVEMGERTPTSAADVLDAFLVGVPADREVVLVPHSNAGLFVPALSARRPVSAVVFVDAAVPAFDRDEVRTASDEIYSFLAQKADAQGILPPWTEWWDEDLTSLFPNDQVRDLVERQQRRLPLSYFTSSVAVPPGWEAGPCAYLAFGSTYQVETEAARERGWPVGVLDGGHLHMTVQPHAVSAEILALLRHVTGRGDGR